MQYSSDQKKKSCTQTLETKDLFQTNNIQLYPKLFDKNLN